MDHGKAEVKRIPWLLSVVPFLAVLFGIVVAAVVVVVVVVVSAPVVSALLGLPEAFPIF